MEIIASQFIETNVLKSNEVSTKDVAKGYGVSIATIREHKKNHSDELLEGIHYVIIQSQRNTPKTMWTLDGIHMLGFFIKSERAKTFRIYVAKLLTEIRNGNASVVSGDSDLQEIIMLQNEQIVQMDREINRLKGILIKLHDGFHAQLEKATNIFQLIGNTKKDGGNLNTETIAGHKYWRLPKK